MSTTLYIKWLGHNSLLGTVMVNMPHGFQETEIVFHVEKFLDGVDIVQELEHLKEQFPYITFKLYQKTVDAVNGHQEQPFYSQYNHSQDQIARLLKDEVEKTYDETEARGNWGFIHVIKVIRERTGMGLQEAKLFAETHFPHTRIRKNGRY